MKFRTAILVGAVLCLFGHQSAFAQGTGGVPGLQAQIDSLAAEVLALQAIAPNPSVAERMYCRTRSDTISFPTGTLGRGVTKMVWSFDLLAPGMVTVDPISRVVTTQGSSGPNTRTGTIGGAQVAANYLQNGSDLTITFLSGNVAHLHVSGDGTLAYGWRIAGSGMNQTGPANIQFENAMIEIGSPAECVPDVVSDFP